MNDHTTKWFRDGRLQKKWASKLKNLSWYVLVYLGMHFYVFVCIRQQWLWKQTSSLYDEQIWTEAVFHQNYAAHIEIVSSKQIKRIVSMKSEGFI